MPQTIVVIGAGVIGLSTAVRLQDEAPPGTAVTIVARDFPEPAETIDARRRINYASAWAGAHNRWEPPLPDASSDDPAARYHGWARETYSHMTRLADERPEAGLRRLKGVEYVDEPGPGHEALDASRAAALGMPGFRQLGPGEIPAGVGWGCEYDTWCAHPMVYCAFLLRRFVVRGGAVVHAELRAVAEVYALREVWGQGEGEPRVVVNCSGMGFSDEEVFITRGQTCVVANDCAATVTRQHADGTWTFCVPRGFDGGTVVGGTKEPDNWDPEPSAAVRETLLRRFAETYPAVLGPGEAFRWVRDIVGRRPTRRGGPRMAAEGLGGGRVVVHAYGLGGRGYELSWGVAGEAVRLAAEHSGGGAGWRLRHHGDGLENRDGLYGSGKGDIGLT